MARCLDVDGSIALFAADPIHRDQILTVLEQAGPSVTVLHDSTQIDRLLKTESLGLLVWASRQDQRPGSSGFADLTHFMASLRRRQPACQVILVTTSMLPLADLYQAVSQGVAGIVDPGQPDFGPRLLQHVHAARQRFRQLQQRSLRLDEPGGSDGLVGRSQALRRVVHLAHKAAAVSDAPVIIYGQSGTGKQRLAEVIHQLDQKRAEHPFVCVNCAAITGSLAESELFGHRKGAFTGATQDRLGYFRAAHGGTILLDEISELPLSLQPKILRLLQERKVMPVGSDKEYEIDVRVIAATNQNLRQQVERGAFRLDLFQRLNVIELLVPSLQERPEDIPELFGAFVRKYAHYYNGRIEKVDAAIYDVLAQAVGAGNVRELENIVRRILAFKEQGSCIELTDLPAELVASALNDTSQPNVAVPERTIEALATGSAMLCQVVQDYEKTLLSRLIDRGMGRNLLAHRLGITRRTLYNKLRKYQLDRF